MEKRIKAKYVNSVSTSIEDEETGEELDTDLCPSYDMQEMICSNCGSPMLSCGFDGREYKEGLIDYKPNFKYCPYCGAEIEQRWTLDTLKEEDPETYKRLSKVIDFKQTPEIVEFEG